MAAPALEREERALATKVREDQVAVDLLRRRERLGVLLEALEPVLAERASLREAICGEIAKTVVVLVNARDRRGDGLKGEPVVDELTDELDEGGVYGCRPSAL